MFKHTQKIRRQKADELFECVWPLCGIGAERVKTKKTMNIELVPETVLYQLHIKIYLE